MENDTIDQSQFIEHVNTKMGKENWITVFKVNNTIAQFSALVPRELTKEILQKPSWELHMDSVRPSLVSRRINGEMVCTYETINSNEVEPLIIPRHFHGIKEDYKEVCEDFRLFHNLYPDKGTDNYYAILDNGDLEEVVKYDKLNQEIQIKSSYLYRYTSAKQKNLALYFDRRIFGNQPTYPTSLRNEEICYEITTGQHPDKTNNRTYAYFSLLIGKKIIFCSSNTNEISYPKGYEEFIISQNEIGELISHECDPNKLANYFGKNPDRPNYVTPVFFKRTVLDKYYNDPKYIVGDNYIQCAGLWRMRIDNNHEKYIIVCLGDLGLYLPNISEQKYWCSFNVFPDGKWSETYWTRCFEAHFADPSNPDLLFKQRFENFSQRWKKKMGWDLFLPLSPEDEHCFTSLHIPCDNNHKNFDQEILHLCKIVIDSINHDRLEAEIKSLDEWLSLSDTERARGIKKLEIYLSNNFPNIFDQHVKFLRNLQKIRSSSAAHRKGENYTKITREINGKSLESYFRSLLLELIKLVDDLLEKFDA